jgi:DNA polymerase-3 subunit delta
VIVSETPVVYILHGDDEYAIADFIKAMEAKMGEQTIAEMNTTRIDGSTFSLDALVSATHAMPFLADRRLVVLNDPLRHMKSKVLREKLLNALDTIPETTALALVIPRPLLNPQEKRRNVQHWLQKWAGDQHWLQTWAGDQLGRAYIREFLLPHGPQMTRWIQNKAVECGGTFTHQAAAILAEYVQEDPRAAAQEIEKLLAYVSYRRPVEPDDVQLLTPFSNQGDVFKLVDAIGNGDGPLALRMLHHLLEVEEPLRLFGMVVRQFRLLLLTRELLDAGNREADIAKQLNTYPFVVRKLMGQVRNFSIEALEEIFRKLLDVDEAIKTGQIPTEVALDTLIASLTH